MKIKRRNQRLKNSASNYKNKYYSISTISSQTNIGFINIENGMAQLNFNRIIYKNDGKIGLRREHELFHSLSIYERGNFKIGLRKQSIYPNGIYMTGNGGDMYS